MKISQMIKILKDRLSEYGDVDVRVWDADAVLMNDNVIVNDFPSDYTPCGRVDVYIGITTEDIE